MQRFRMILQSSLCILCLTAGSATAQLLNAPDITQQILKSAEVPSVEAIAEAARKGWTPQQAAEVGEAFEQTRQWSNAIRVYEASLKSHPSDDDVKYALRRTRVHYAIDRRYSDGSFDKDLLRQTRSESLDLMEDVMTRVQMEYVERISPMKFIAHGTESLYMALGNKRFVDKHLSGVTLDRIQRLRQILVNDFWNKRVASRTEARMTVSQVCEVARREVNLSASAVVMEYLFGGCNALDDYSIFLTPDRYRDLFGSIQGEFVGIGIEMEAEKGKGMHLVNVLMESPAETGGLRPGDHIVEIDGQNCKEFSTDDAARLLRGTRGSRVNLRYQTPDGSIESSTLTRRPVQVRSVTRTMMLDDYNGIGYIQMTGFQSSTEEELEAALRKLEAQGMKKLIWDLRGNPGGLLDTAAAVLERFIDRGTLVTTEGRSVGQNQRFASNGRHARDMPLVLLVDQNSASASEIVAGAIKDHGRGQIVGRKTYGKWSVQTIVHLPGNTGLKLTTARFYSPNHKNYASIGLEPDVNVELPREAMRTLFRARTSDEIRIDPDVAKAIDVLNGDA